MPASNNTSARLQGRSLSDLWLDGEEEKLHPGEWKLLECAAQGVPCHLGDTRPTHATKDNLIRAEFLRFIALGGDTEYDLHEKGIILGGAYIECTNVGLNFSGSTLFSNLVLANCKINGDVFLQDCKAETLALTGCELNALRGDRLKTTGSILLRDGFRAIGEVRLLGAKIGGELDCCDGEFSNENLALGCDKIEINGSVFLNQGFRAKGEVRFLSAIIGSDLDCRSGIFTGKEQSLCTQRAEIGGDVFLGDGFLSLAAVDLSDTTIKGNLICDGGIFSSKNIALNATRIKVNGRVKLGKECRVAGEVSFQSATIGGDISFAHGSFEGRPSINMRNAEIAGMLVWRDVDYARGELTLAGAKCLSLNMDWASWKKPSQIRLDNFAYDRFGELPDGCNGAFWVKWLERQPESHLTTKFRPNPYQHLAVALDKMGHENEALAVRIEQKDRQRVFSSRYETAPSDSWSSFLRSTGNFWSQILRIFTGYGYRPGLAVLWLIGLVIAGTAVYEFAARKGVMTPTHPLIYKEAIWKLEQGETPVGKIPIACRENWVYPANDISADCQSSVASEYSTFNSFIYSADIAIPIVNFRMESDWSPRVVNWKTGQSDSMGWWIRVWEWVQIFFGWVFSLLFVSAIGGIIRRE